MVGIVVVSHSAELASGVVALAREMSGPELRLEAAGGFEEEGALGTDAGRVLEAVQRAMSADGVLVLMDLGSALMSAEFAVEMLGDDAGGPVRLSGAPLVEGAVAAAVAAAGGASLDEVASEALGALAMKTAQVGDPGAESASESRTRFRRGCTGCARRAPGSQRDRLTRAAGGAVRRRGARVRSRRAGGEGRRRRAGQRPFADRAGVAGRSARGHAVVTAAGPDAADAVAALEALAADGFGDGVTAARWQPAVAASAVAIPHLSEKSSTPALERTPAPAAGERAQGRRGVGRDRDRAGPLDRWLRLADARAAARARRPATPPHERALLDAALDAARTAIEHDRGVIAGRAGAAEAEIFDAHLALLDDDALLEPARAAIDGGQAAETAWYHASEHVAAVYRALPDPLLAERATDVVDVGRRVLEAFGAAGKFRRLARAPRVPR